MTLNVLGVGMHGLTGSALINLIQLNPFIRLCAPCRGISDIYPGPQFLSIDASSIQSWLQCLEHSKPDVIILLSNIRHFPPLYDALKLISFYPRLIIVGTTGIYSRFSSYSGVYKEIEKMACTYPSSLTVIRPSMIYGNRNDKNLHKVFLFIARNGFIPLVGKGQNMVQPVYYRDLASAIYNTLILDPRVNAFDVAGPVALPMIELFTEIFLVLGKKPRFLFLDSNLSRFACSLISLFPFSRSFPVTTEQIDRLTEDKIFDISMAQAHLYYSPTPLRKSLLLEALELELVC